MEVVQHGFAVGQLVHGESAVAGAVRDEVLDGSAVAFRTLLQAVEASPRGGEALGDGRSTRRLRGLQVGLDYGGVVTLCIGRLVEDLGEHVVGRTDWLFAASGPELNSGENQGGAAGGSLEGSACVVQPMGELHGGPGCSECAAGCKCNQIERICLTLVVDRQDVAVFAGVGGFCVDAAERGVDREGCAEDLLEDELACGECLERGALACLLEGFELVEQRLQSEDCLDLWGEG